MLMIRLSRRGARKQPHYRIVVIEKDRARDGRSVEVVGTYNPRTDPATIVLKPERVDYWVCQRRPVVGPRPQDCGQGPGRSCRFIGADYSGQRSTGAARTGGSVAQRAWTVEDDRNRSEHRCAG